MSVQGAEDLNLALQAAFGASEHRMYLPRFDATVDGIMDAAEVLFSKLEKLELKDLSPESTSALALLLQRPECMIKELTLFLSEWVESSSGDQERDVFTGNTIDVEAIADALKSPHCKVTSLVIINTAIEKNGVIAIADALVIPH